MTSMIVDEVVNNALDRESEGADWRNAISILTRMSALEVCSEILDRIMNVTRSFLPSLRLETTTNSWSELIILVDIAVSLFFDSLLTSQMFLPEVLHIVSLLIDVGPTELRSSVHKLLMNVCQSFSTNESLSESNKVCLEEITNIFSVQKLKFMFGFSQDKGRVLQNFSASSFLTKFCTLEHFITNIMALVDNVGSEIDARKWKAKYNKHVMDCVFTTDSFLSARATMILGILGKAGISNGLVQNLLQETMKVAADPHITDELLFFLISHSFTYSKIVEGLDPDSYLLKQLFWLSTTFAQSPNIIFYQGGLLFMSNCAKRICLSNCQDGTASLVSVLFDSRQFADSILAELEAMNDMRWTKDNLCHILINLISKGLLVPYIKVTSLECLKLFFKLMFYDSMCESKPLHLNFMFFLYLVLRPIHFTQLLDEVDLVPKFVSLDGQNKVPSEMVGWLESNSKSSNVTLYQGAAFFATGMSDEPSKLRFLSQVRHLAKSKPEIVFKFYPVIQPELRRLASLETSSELVKTAFDVIRLVVVHKSYFKLDEFKKNTDKFLEEMGLRGIKQIEFKTVTKEVMSGVEGNLHVIYKRKKLVAMITSRMTCQM